MASKGAGERVGQVAAAMALDLVEAAPRSGRAGTLTINQPPGVMRGVRRESTARSLSRCSMMSRARIDVEGTEARRGLEVGGEIGVDRMRAGRWRGARRWKHRGRLRRAGRSSESRMMPQPNRRRAGARDRRSSPFQPGQDEGRAPACHQGVGDLVAALDEERKRPSMSVTLGNQDSMRMVMDGRRHV